MIFFFNDYHFEVLVLLYSYPTCKTVHQVVALAQVNKANEAMCAIFNNHFKVFLMQWYKKFKIVSINCTEKDSSYKKDFKKGLPLSLFDILAGNANTIALNIAVEHLQY